MTLADEVASATAVLREHLGCGRVLYGDLEGGRTLVVEPASHEVEAGVGRWELGAWWPPEARQAFEQGDAIVCRDVAQDARLPAQTRAAYESWGVAAFVNVPVLERGRVVAVAVVQDPVRRDWTDEEVALVARTAARVRRG